MLDDGYQNKFYAFWNQKKLVRFCLKFFSIAQFHFQNGYIYLDSIASFLYCYFLFFIFLNFITFYTGNQITSIKYKTNP